MKEVRRWKALAATAALAVSSKNHPDTKDYITRWVPTTIRRTKKNIVCMPCSIGYTHTKFYGNTLNGTSTHKSRDEKFVERTLNAEKRQPNINKTGVYPC